MSTGTLPDRRDGDTGDIGGDGIGRRPGKCR